MKTTKWGISFQMKGAKDMNQIEIGKFIAQCRKDKKMTQIQLAAKLGITDRAVSKWETGKSMPDSSVMLELCEILEITVNELLSGERISSDSTEKKADQNLIDLKRKDERNMSKNAIASVLLSSACLVGIVVCLVCDLVTAGSLTWSLIPAISILFAWLVLFPAIRLWKKGILISFISLSIFILPYLFVLSCLLGIKEVFSIGSLVAIASIVFLWIAVIIFHRMEKIRKAAAAGIVSLLMIPFVLLLNLFFSRVLDGSFPEGEHLLFLLFGMIIFLILALVGFGIDYAQRKGFIKEGKS